MYYYLSTYRYIHVYVYMGYIKKLNYNKFDWFIVLISVCSINFPLTKYGKHKQYKFAYLNKSDNAFGMLNINYTRAYRYLKVLNYVHMYVNMYVFFLSSWHRL